MMLGEWEERGRSPFKMIRGDVVVDGNVAYFMSDIGQVCLYDSTTQRWSVLPECPYRFSSLSVIRGLLTAIGGSKEGGTDKLLSIVTDTNILKWMEHFPPMPTKRYQTAAATMKQHLIVAGGVSQLNQLDTVEVMDFETLVWLTAASLPHPFSWTSVTICGDQLYMLGGFDKDSRSKSGLTCSLTKLLQSCSETSSDSVWHRITDAPVHSSTCEAVNGELVAVGGTDAVDTAAVHKYNPTTDSWDIISNMPTARYRCLVAVLPTNEVMVIGGYIGSNSTDIVEIASMQCT